MRDVNYGFSAIEHRYRVLGGIAVQISEDRKFDLSRSLIDLYGPQYIAHPRLESLLEKNKITAKDFMTGKQEAEAFDHKEFVKLHQSTLRKVDCLASIFERTLNGNLKTKATWFDRHAVSLVATGEWLKEHWLVTGLIAVGGLLTFILRAREILSIFKI